MEKNEIYPKRYIQSFTVGNGSRNRDAIERACQLRKEELQSKAEKDKQDCFFYFEVIEGMDNNRVNVYDCNARDIFEIGFNFCLAQKEAYSK